MRTIRSRSSTSPLIRPGDTVRQGWAEATAEPVFLTRMLDEQAPRCPPFTVFFALSFAEGYRGDHANVTVTSFGGEMTVSPAARGG